MKSQKKTEISNLKKIIYKLLFSNLKMFFFLFFIFFKQGYVLYVEAGNIKIHKVKYKTVAVGIFLKHDVLSLVVGKLSR